MMDLRGSPLAVPYAPSAELAKLCDAIEKGGGSAILVGGCVRDHLQGRSSKDIDVEVYGISLERLNSILSSFDVYAVGQSFGVLKTRVGDVVFDVSLPRIENKSGSGHRGFIVETDPNLSFKTASSRRDFTINAMGINLKHQELLDHHEGFADLKLKRLRHVSQAFVEDPLRVFRACQFVARLGFFIDPKTLQVCHTMTAELKTLPKERIAEEIKKLLLGQFPSEGLDALQQTHAWSLFPELVALLGCPQDPHWHPEGDVWTHTKMVVDEAQKIRMRDGLDDDEALVLILGALCHDLGKPKTTNFEDGRIRSKGHEEAGVAPTLTLLSSMGFSAEIFEAVAPLVKDHLKPAQLYQRRDEVSDASIRRLASRVSIKRLCRVAEADFLGRTTADALLGHDPSVHWLTEQAERLLVHQNAPKPILMGRHLIARGMKAGPQLGAILTEAFEAQLDGAFSDETGAMAWLTQRMERID